ncbi:MAG: serine--tRNA ligase, partial [Verrucomicrobiota bacterium]
MLDIRLIREKPEMVKERLAARGAGDETHVDEVLALDEKRRKSLAEVESLKAQRNRVSKEIGALMAQKKIAEADARKAETRQIGDQITALDKVVAQT